ncbi:hypothetical protein AO1008_11886 [Aspergillus oryzae 100-8]|uniref:Integral membrane protein n=1 Tax=Aspergillus oryzae (strain 3.042) TaxID=1160506 RepID=I8THM0_ASPO3|nr:hypothetical protein Ao3042_10536 [Aspergillus oryzae 3.042]KDE75555.1 hypothetical protein AO1008_11886 [Aspergillus oryzae 100-8]|eukprot:EIT73535.1 hypothetical protein Ao3042_10536 [Aspergillus oryzae 3.042]
MKIPAGGSAGNKSSYLGIRTHIDDNNAFILWQTLFRPIMGANDRGKTYITVSAVLVALSTIVVGFRIVARWMRTTLGMDDYVICVSIILAYSMLGEAVVCIPVSESSAPVYPPFDPCYGLYAVPSRGVRIIPMAHRQTIGCIEYPVPRRMNRVVGATENGTISDSGMSSR